MTTIEELRAKVSPEVLAYLDAIIDMKSDVSTMNNHFDSIDPHSIDTAAYHPEEDFVDISTNQLIAGTKVFQPAPGNDALIVKGRDGGIVDNIMTIEPSELVTNRAHTIPDAGGNAEFVMSKGNQSVEGVKTLSQIAKYNDDKTFTTDQDLVAKKYVDTGLSGKASTSHDHNSAYVGLTGNQSVGGVKTFTSIPVGPSSDPQNDNDLARKAYVDTKFGAVSIPDNAVTESKIANGAVTEGKIANLAVTEGKIANGAVTPSKLSTAYLPTSGGTIGGDLSIEAAGLLDGDLQVDNSVFASYLAGFGLQSYDTFYLSLLGDFALDGVLVVGEGSYIEVETGAAIFVPEPTYDGEAASKLYVDTGLAGKSATTHNHNLTNLSEKNHGSLAGIGANDHHNQSHALNSADHTNVTAAEFNAKISDADFSVSTHTHSPNLPIGTVLMYAGTWVNNSTIPGWYMCDGNNGTPNLSGKFIRGATTSGGSGGGTSGNASGNTDNSAAFNTGGSGDLGCGWAHSGHTHKVDSHTHPGRNYNSVGSVFASNGASAPNTGDHLYNHYHTTGSHAHSVGGHAHGLGSHTHSISTPPYYDLIFIQRRA